MSSNRHAGPGVVRLGVSWFLLGSRKRPLAVKKNASASPRFEDAILRKLELEAQAGRRNKRSPRPTVSDRERLKGII